MYICLFVLNTKFCSAGWRVACEIPGQGLGQVSRKGTSGVILKEQEAISHEEEIKLRLGRGGKGVPGTGKGTCEATVEPEHLARLGSSGRSRRLTPRPREARWVAQGWRNGGVTPGSAWGGGALHASPWSLDSIYSTAGSQGRQLAGE